MNMNKPNMIEKGMAILIDFDRKIYARKPATRQAVAVLVPDWNIAHMHPIPTIIKKNLSFLILFVMPNITKATAVEAMPMPKFAASL